MATITKEQDARRLARAIAADLKLYNPESIEAEKDLSAEVEEGRELYERRVAPPLHALFDEAMAALAPEIRYQRPDGTPPSPGTGGRSPQSRGDASTGGAPLAARSAQAARPHASEVPRAAAANRFASFYGDGSAPDREAASEGLPEAVGTRRATSRVAVMLLVMLVVSVAVFYLFGSG